jgi:PTH1 family peptidyl-tRNA hydrolase
MITLVAFLGNYGSEYSGTRHNVAWQFAESLDCISSVNWQKKFKGLFASKTIEGRQVFFLKPETYMNLSGDSIGEAAHFYKIKPEEILVVHDELELPPGTISLKWSGGLGGHNGLRSTKAVLQTADFWRLRFGIGRPEHPDIAGYVLSNFSSEERILFSQQFARAGELFEKLIEGKNPDNLLNSWKKVLPQ